MKKTQVTATICYWITRICAILYFIMASYATIALVFKTTALHFVDNKEGFEINYPFTQKPFLLGFYNLTYIIFDFLGIMILYGFFFLLLSNVFKVFMQKKLFTKKSLYRLTLFYNANIFIPCIVLVFFAFFSQLKGEDSVIAFLHILLGIFTFFLAAIFRKGLELQDNQDLII